MAFLHNDKTRQVLRDVVPDELKCAKFMKRLSAHLKYLGETKILMSPSLVIFSLSITLLFNYGFGIIEYASGQINTTHQLQQLQINQNESHVNASQIQDNGSAGNLSSACDTSYPDFCVTTYSANLTCMDIPQKFYSIGTRHSWIRF